MAKQVSITPEQAERIHLLNSMYRNVIGNDLKIDTPQGLMVTVHIGGDIPQSLVYSVNSDGEARYLTQI